MSETAVATPPAGTPGSGEGAPSHDLDNPGGDLGFESKGALLAAMGLPDREEKGVAKPTTSEPATPTPTKEDGGDGGESGFTYEFAGRQYHGATEAEAKAKAEHAYKVHQGQAKAAQARETQLRREKAQLEQRLKATPAAPAPPTTPPAAAPPKAPVSPEKAAAGEDNLLGLSDGDWQYVQSLRAKGEHDLADAYLLTKQEEALKKMRGASKAEIEAARQEMQRELESLRKPIKDREQQQEQFNQAVESLRNRATLISEETGDPVYPEMQNDADLAEIVDTWERMCSPVADYPALPPEIATHPAGFHLAYTIWFHETWGDFIRQLQSEGYTPDGKGGKGATPPTPPAAVAPPRPVGPGRLTAPVAMPGSVPRREPLAPSDPQAAFKKALVSAEDNLI